VVPAGNVATATALAANGTNCTAGQFPLGVDASGAAESCTALPTTIAGTANQITASAATGAVTLSIPTNPTLPGTTTGTFSGNLTGNVTGNVSGTSGSTTGNAATSTALAANGANCSAGNYPLGVDAAGNAEGCTAASGGGYTLTGAAATYASPADTEVLYWGSWAANQPTNGGGDARIYIPKTGTITKVYGWVYTGGASGTGESSTLVVRKNNTTDTTVSSSITTNSVQNPFNGTVSIAVTAGDYIEFKFTCATWATNPTNIRFYAVALIE